MTRTAAVLLFLLTSLALPAFATDYSIEATANSLQTGAEGVTRVPVTAGVAFGARLFRVEGPAASPIVIEFDVPGEVQVARGYDGFECQMTKPVRCVAQALYDPVAFVAHVETKMTTPGLQKATIRIIAPADTNPDNNVSTYEVDVVDKPSLSAYAGFGRYRLEPLQPAQLTMQVGNSGATATNVVATTALTNGGTITAVGAPQGNAPATCTFTPAVATCVAPVVPGGTYFGVDVKIAAPDRLDGGVVRAEVRAMSSEGDFDESDNFTTYETVLVRHVLVTNLNDEGAGSLRQALLDARTLRTLDPCTIDFRIPGSGPFVIEPFTPLPDVAGTVKIDGKTQTAFGGDILPDGPEIVLDGSLLPPGSNGLVLREGCEIQVLDLEVRGFSNSAIEARRGSPNYDTCRERFDALFPPTLIARNVVHGNGRGVVVLDSGFVTVEDNVLRDNERSGIFAQRATYLDIARNRIEGNGASGIFLDVGTREYYAGGADITNNVITRNAHWGIARTRNGEIAVLDNSIFANNHSGIDVDLDFETPDQLDDSKRPPNRPHLTSATFDATSNQTIVRGSFASKDLGYGHFTVQLFASDALSAWGHAEGQTVVLTKNDVPAGAFELAVDGDLRGKYITATLTRSHIIGFAQPPSPKITTFGHLYSIPADTSEFSDAVVAR